MPKRINEIPMNADAKKTAAIPATIRIKPRIPIIARKFRDALSTSSSGSSSLGLVFGLGFCFAGLGIAGHKKENPVR